MEAEPTSEQVQEFVQDRNSISYEDESGAYDVIPAVREQAVTISPRKLREDRETCIDWIATFKTNLEASLLGVFGIDDNNDGRLYVASDDQSKIIREKALRVLAAAIKKGKNETEDGLGGWTVEADPGTASA